MDVQHARPATSDPAPTGRRGVDRAVVAVVVTLVVAVGAVVALALGGELVRPASEVGRAAAAPTSTTTKPRAGSEGRGAVVGRAFPEIYGSDLQFGKAVVVRPGTGAPTVVVLWNASCACDAMYHVVPDAARRSAVTPNVVGIAVDTSLTEAAQTAIASGQAFPSVVDTPGQVKAALGEVGPGVIVLDDNLRIVGQFPPTVTEAQLGDFLARMTGATTTTRGPA